MKSAGDTDVGGNEVTLWLQLSGDVKRHDCECECTPVRKYCRSEGGACRCLLLCTFEIVLKYRKKRFSWTCSYFRPFSSPWWCVLQHQDGRESQNHRF